MSDLHGCYDKYIKMLEKIDFSLSDNLYILGDILDRGPNPIKIILDLMTRSNVVVIAGNHCVMASQCLSFLMQEITDESIDEVDDQKIGKLTNWLENGAQTTIEEFHKCYRSTQEEILEFISDFEVYDEIEVAGKTFVLVHAGLDNFAPEKKLWEYELNDLIWTRPNYNICYYDNKYLVTGHTPTMAIKSNLNPGYIYQVNNHIAIDCGCTFDNGRLGCLRLDDFAEFYI